MLLSEIFINNLNRNFNKMDSKNIESHTRFIPKIQPQSNPKSMK